MDEVKEEEQKIKHKFNRLLRILGPGLITGAADDDPSGIATYSQTGAQFGYGQLWTVILMYPLMTAVQETCARIGAVTGKGLAAVVKTNYSKKVLYAIVLLVVVANTINIGADIGAMAASANLIFPIPFAALALFFTASVLLLEIFTSYKKYAKILKWLAFALLAYPVTAIIAGQNWPVVLRATVIPHIELNFGFFFILTGVLGTTISPYMFFWQASEEVEEEISTQKLTSQDSRPHIGRVFLKNLRIDNALGMLFSEIVTWFIIITTASVLHAHGVTNISTASQAAKALEPLVSTFPNSGFLAKTIFATGVVGIGLLAVPVLAGSASYALSEAFQWKEGLYRKLKKAHGFYGVITIATAIGLAINFVGIDPMKALVFTAVFNGVAAVPLVFLITKVSRSEKIMGEHKSGPISSVLLWITFIAMLLSALALLVTIVLK
ncbi:MAG TPA: divalent metal cation transporter [Patescibacteria group bacterium]|jgi:NRAMP (natural resistance-associated macrophage protein)-like metal ion transporter|nr:divalent metal cation transporter [Patescibacteria group bacterium]